MAGNPSESTTGVVERRNSNSSELETLRDRARALSGPENLDELRTILATMETALARFPKEPERLQIAMKVLQDAMALVGAQAMEEDGTEGNTVLDELVSATQAVMKFVNGPPSMRPDRSQIEEQLKRLAGMPRTKRDMEIIDGLVGDLTRVIAVMPHWLPLTVENLKRRIARIGHPPPNPISVPVIPPEAIRPPKPPEGLPAGWFREIPQEKGTLLAFARLLPDGEALELRRRVFGRPGEEGYSSGHDIADLVFEMTLVNRTPANAAYGHPRDRGYSPDECGPEFSMRTHDNFRCKRTPGNHSYHGAAGKRLGKEHELARMFDDGYFEIPPGGQASRYMVFERGWGDNMLEPFAVNKVYLGDWRLLPTQVELFPYGIKLPAQVVLEVTVPKIPEGRIFDRASRKYETGRWYAPGLEVAGGKSSTGGGSRLFFMTDDKVFVPFSTGVAYVTATCAEAGPHTLVEAEALGHPGGGHPINVTPAWDPRAEPPAEVPRKPVPRPLWQVNIGGDYNRVRAFDRCAVLMTHHGPWQVVDAEGDMLFPALNERYDDVAVGAGGAALFTLRGSRLTGLEPAGGKVMDIGLGSGAASLALMGGDELLVGFRGRELHRLEVWGTDGRRRRELPETPFYAGPAVSRDGKRVALATGEYPHMLALMTAELEELGRYEFAGGSGPGAVAFSPDGGHILLDAGGCIVCLKASGGLEKVWEFSGGSDVTAGDAFTGLGWLGDGSGVAASTRRGFLHLLDSGGNLRYRWRVDGNGIDGLAAFYGGSGVLVATHDGLVHCLDMALREP